jgi:hypothetical protein
MEEVLSRYYLISNLTPLLFTFVVIIEAIICIAFLLQSIGRIINCAYILSIGLWCLFLVTDEFFIVYSLEKTHGLLLALSLLSFMNSKQEYNL